MVTVAALAVVSAAGAVQNPPTLNGSSGIQKVTPFKMPLGASTQQMTVVVQLQGDPVAVQDANAPAPLTDAQRRSARDQLRQQQQPVESQIQSQGGKVLASYQSAYNGIKVRIQAREAYKLSSLPGVVAVHPVQQMKPSNIHGIPLIGAPEVWGGTGAYHGEGMKIGIIDTGIDYTHADFGGPGTPAQYQLAHENETVDPALISGLCVGSPCFGPGAKVAGGTDLVGDTYNADPTSPSYQPNPVPDPNPIDCYGHGSHVAGTAAGEGVLSDGSTYTGTYDASTVSGNSWNVGPGVAPKAELYAIKIFGCQGSTDETIDGIDWAVQHGMDVINMSLGSPFGSADDPAAQAATNAARDGVIVVASSGNEGSNPYMTGSPASGSGAISVAALDPTQQYPGAAMALSSGGSVTALDANGAALPSAPLPVKVLWTDASHTSISLGCDPSDYAVPGVSGALVITKRGTCARVARAVYGQQAGAAAVLMVNSSDSYPPYEGKITSNPDTGVPYTVTIPFLGAKSSDAGSLVAADGGTATLSSTLLANPSYLGVADFSSYGPRTGDSALKPDVTAPGVSIASVGIGTGDAAVIESGTSMAAPHTSGMAALVKQAHPDWRRVEYWKAAIANTADPGQVANYSVVGAGTGLIQAVPATQTQVVALGDRDTASLSYGFNELMRDYNRMDFVTLRNFGSSPASFSVTTDADTGVPHSVSLTDSSITVPPHGERHVGVRLSVPAGSAGSGIFPGLGDPFGEVAGLVTFTPSGGSNNGVTLRVPYYMVPQAVSNVDVRVNANRLRQTNQAVATITNRHGAIPGTADWYAWGLRDRRDRGLGSNDLRGAGVQTFPGAGVLVFAISTQRHWSNAAQNEFDVLIDLNGDGTPDYDVFAADYGAVTSGEFDGIDAVFTDTLATGNITFAGFVAGATDSSTMTLPVLFDQLCDSGAPCLDASNPRLSYTVESFGLTDNTTDSFTGSASFNAFNPAISTGMYDVVPPNGYANETITVDPTEWAQTPALGVMVVSTENPSGSDEATFVPLNMFSHGRRH